MTDDEKQKIRATQIEMVYKSTVQTIPALALVLGGLAYLIGLQVHDATPYLWALLVYAVYIYRMWVARRALAAHLAPADLIAHSSMMSILTSLVGVLAGGGLLYFFPRLPGESQALVTMVCIGWIAGAVGVSGLYPRYIEPWFVIFGGALILSWAFFGHDNRWLVAFMLLFLVVYLWITVKEIGNKTVESIAIRFANVELLRTKSRFMAAASHDLRQPLMLIDVIHKNLTRASDLDDAKEQAAKVMRAVRSFGSILDSLVMIARLDTKPPEPIPADIDLGALRDEIAEEFQARVEVSGVDLRVGADPFVVTADRELLKRCWTNLIDNAFKFTARGSIVVDLAVRDSLVLSIADTGRGISETALPHIFDEGYREPNAVQDASRGLGIGLTIVKRLVDLQGGEISVESKVGTGSTFRIRLPLTNVRRVEQPATTRQAPDTAVEPSVSTFELLFIEDDRDIQDEWSEWCTRFGHVGFFASDGAAARSLATDADFRPDAIVADYRLPDDNGLRVIADLQRTWSGVPAVLLTGDTDPAIAEAASAAGVLLLRKPADPDRLVSEIAAMVQR